MEKIYFVRKTFLHTVSVRLSVQWGLCANVSQDYMSGQMPTMTQRHMNKAQPFLYRVMKDCKLNLGGLP
jgi:hypothetical protein